MYTLANLEDVFRERCVNDVYLPCPRNEGWSEECGYHDNDTDVEDNDVTWVAGKEVWHYFLLEQYETKSFFAHENTILQIIHFFLVLSLIAEYLS